MTQASPTYCLDSNVLIEAWRKYYSPSICPEYWDVLNALGSSGQIFIPEEIRDEIIGTEDDLTVWLKGSSIPVRETTGAVTACWSRILDHDELHQYLVAESAGRSLADPWVISHALDAGAIVVTKEDFVPNPRKAKIKIPNVCHNMKIDCINDFQFVKALGIRFSCQLT
jgi:hypothetical protein